jgi:D-ribose pyranase
VKKTGLLNQPLSAVIAGLGHTDTIAITDAGLSIPTTIQRIDLAVSAGVPGFLSVMRAVLGEMQISGAVIASELAEHSPLFFVEVVKLLDGAALTQIPHSELLQMTQHTRAAVRTGEFTPFANIILISEVIF